MTKSNLLEGNIKKQLISLALPLLMGNILQQLYNTIDAIIVGHYLGTSAFAALGIAGTIMNLFIFILNGFCVGICTIFAQLYGSGDIKTFRNEVFISICIGVFITIFMSILSILFLPYLLKITHTPQELMTDINSYLKIIIAGLFSTYLYNLFSCILRAIGNTKSSLYFLFLAVVCNVILDIIFIAYFHIGVSGAAFATVASQFFAFIGCLFYFHKYNKNLFCKKEDFYFYKPLLYKTIRFGSATALQESSLYIGKILVQGNVNTLGTANIAAYTAAMRIEGFANSFGSSCSEALCIFISQNFGANHSERIKQGFQKGMFLHISLGIVLSILLYLLAPVCITFFLGSAEKDALFSGVAYMKCIALFYVLCFIGNAFVGYFRGISKITVPFIGTTLQITLRVIFSYLLLEKFGLAAVALATGIGWNTIVIYQITMFLKIKYQKVLFRNKNYNSKCSI